MRSNRTDRKLDALHGIVASYPYDFFGYFGWPTVARMEDGSLIVAASGMRNDHVCPFGRTVICTSTDAGETWSAPAVVNDFPVDDRDAGIISLTGDSLLISWFSADTRISPAMKDIDSWDDERKTSLYRDGLRRITDATAEARAGFWVRASHDRGETWKQPIRVALTAPHGPIALSDGRLLYFGKGALGELADTQQRNLDIGAMESRDLGATWRPLGTVPLAPGTDQNNYHEPHVVEVGPDHLLGLIRVQNWDDDQQLERIGEMPFSMAQTISTDGGTTWTQAELLGFHGSPPHLIRHSTGVLVGTYGYRKEPFGQRIMLSYDQGDTWEHDLVLRDDGPDTDLGYPSSVELGDGSILSVYYQKNSSTDEKCSLLWSRWQLPDRILS